MEGTQRLSARGQNILLACLQCFYWSSSALYFGYLVMYLTEKGYSEFYCGLAQTVIAILIMVAQPLVGYITDTFIPYKKFILGGMGLAILTTYLLPATWAVFPVALLCMLLQALTVQTASPVIDSWTIALRRKCPGISFGLTRSCGSVGFAVSSLIIGSIIAKLGIDVIFPGHILMLVLMLAVAVFLPNIPCKNRNARPEEPQPEASKRLSTLQAAKVLFTNRAYVIFLCSTLFMNLTCRSYGTFAALIVADLGGDAAVLGIAMFCAAFFEFPAMIVTTRLLTHRGWQVEYLYLLSVSLMFVRGFLQIFITQFWQYILLQALQGISYGMLLALVVEYIAKLIPEQINSTAMSVYMATIAGLGSIFGCFLGGWIMEQFQLSVYYWVMALSALLGAVIFLPNVLAVRRERLRDSQNQPLP